MKVICWYELEEIQSTYLNIDLLLFFFLLRLNKTLLYCT